MKQSNLIEKMKTAIQDKDTETLNQLEKLHLSGNNYRSKYTRKSFKKSERNARNRMTRKSRVVNRGLGKGEKRTA